MVIILLWVFVCVAVFRHVISRVLNAVVSQVTQQMIIQQKEQENLTFYGIWHNHAQKLDVQPDINTSNNGKHMDQSHP